MYALRSVALLASAIALAAATSSCRRTCTITLDCGDEGYCSLGHCSVDCFSDQDCRTPASCPAQDSTCEPLGLYCSANNKCHGGIEVAPPVRPTPPTAEEADGFGLPPGSGYTFIVNRLAIAGRDRGFDLDASCASGINRECSDNSLAALGDYGNDQINIGLIEGTTLLLVEIAGIDEPYDGDDSSVAVKIYAARDADEPASPRNNFSQPPGANAPCCEFRIAPGSLNADRSARSVLPAQIIRHRIVPLRTTTVAFTLAVGSPNDPDIVLQRALISGRLSPDLDELDEALLGGAVPMSTLATTGNPYCQAISASCPTAFNMRSTLLDLVTSLVRNEPDIDLDPTPDGLECVLDVDGDGMIDRCCDGAGAATCTDALRRSCTRVAVEPFDVSDPASCVKRSAMADGYSVAINFTAVRAHIVGQ